MIDQLYLLILVPFIVGITLLLHPRQKGQEQQQKGQGSLFAKIISIAATAVTFYLSCLIFIGGQNVSNDIFLIDAVNRFIVPAIGLFGLLTVLYSFRDNFESRYFGYILITLSASLAAVVSNNIVLLVVFWGFLGLTLYLLIGLSGEKATTAAKKTFIIVGGSDAVMLIGIAILWFISVEGSGAGLTLNSIKAFRITQINVPLGLWQPGSRLAIVAFLCLAVASFAKAGAMPFHTWIPDMAEVTRVPVTAFLPASLDKLLGIYLLARLCLNVFKLNQSMMILLMLVGAITIIAAVFMAMVQHDLKKLLSYHAVSQVGYMVLGIGTGVPVGIAGGLFHMLNNAIYKSCLFLCGGSVEDKTGTSDLDKLGGLAKLMPLTFVAALIASLSISGVPPFNGFVSKWMIYQGIIAGFPSGGILQVIFLAAAMFGSALTLASFMKVMHAVFLGQGGKRGTPGTAGAGGAVSGETHWTKWLPQIILAVLCVVFGVFAFQFPLKYFILPAVPGVQFSGVWQPGIATTLMVIGIVLGFVIYLISRLAGSKLRQGSVFIGGESLPEDVRVTGVDFYQTIRDIPFFKVMYYLAERKTFDIYNWGKNIVLSFAGILSFLHTGNLHTYITWCIVGVVILLFVIAR
ncbi:MAG: proton-conducting transporter membrane subunit [Elusimicrobiota bacterium]